jgi:hypothetical protein
MFIGDYSGAAAMLPQRKHGLRNPLEVFSMTNQAQVLPRTIARDDQIYRETKWLSAIIIPFLIAAFYILFLRPTETGELFAWQIKPTMTAMMLASAYIGGVYYFVCVLIAKRWHHIKAGMLPVTAFAATLGVATILHWDRFNHSHISFFTWTALYMTTPFLVIATWLRNRATDPGTADQDDVVISMLWRWVMGIVGTLTIAVSLLLFLQPTLMIAVWPWQLTPLTARVVGAMFALPGLVGLGIAVDSRWSNARLILQTQAFSILFILISAVRAWGEFNQSNLATYLFVGGLTFMLIGIIALSFFMESQRIKS